MKISAQEEYGLRILIRIARADSEEGLSIQQLSEAEGLSTAYVAKLTRMLRLAGIIYSQRGQKGGYILARPTDEIFLKPVLYSLGGALYDQAFCEDHAGVMRLCTNSVDCSVRSLWRMVQMAVDRLLDKVTLKDLMASEQDAVSGLQRILEVNALV